MFSLSQGAVRAMCSDNQPNPADAPIILQVLQVKAVSTGGSERQRAMLSDGVHFVTGMMAQNVQASGKVQTDSIVQLDRYLSNLVSGRHVIIILGITVLEPVCERIGHAVDVETVLQSSNVALPPQPANTPLYNSTNFPSNNVTSAAATHEENKMDRPLSSSSNPYGRQSASPAAHGSNSNTTYGRGGGDNSMLVQAPIVRSSVASGATPIASLNMYNNRWTLQARITVKSDIKTWSNAKGEGSLFSVELLDSTQDIRATFFKEAVDKFYHMLQVGSVYSFTGGRLKVANLQYNTCKSQYEITFDQNAEIHLANDDPSIAKQHFEFVKISALEGMAANKTVDVLAVVKSVSEPANLVSKKTGQELTKCDAVLTDDSGVEVNLTIWGDRARSAPQDLSGHPVVAVGRARVSDYGGGVSLSAGPTLMVRPDVPEAAPLASWWSREGVNGGLASRSLSGSGGGAGKMDSWADRKPIATIKQEQLGNDSSRADYLSFRGTLSFIKNNKDGGSWYPACANAGEPCKNRYKVSQNVDGQWFCEKCEQQYPNCVYRWIFSGVVEDATSSTWVSFFNEQAESLLGTTADVAHGDTNRSGDFDADAYNSVFVKAQYSEWIFKCKVKSEFHNDESRVKTSVASMHPVNYLQESRDLLSAIAQF